MAKTRKFSGQIYVMSRKLNHQEQKASNGSDGKGCPLAYLVAKSDRIAFG